MLLRTADGGWLSPRHPHSFLHSSKARQGISYTLPSSFSSTTPYTGKQATTHTPASCVKKCIYSARTQYSIATKATIVSLKTNKPPTSKTTNKDSKSSPPYSTDPWPSGPNKPSVTSDSSPTPSLPGKAQRVALVLWEHLLPQHPTPPVGLGC